MCLQKLPMAARDGLLRPEKLVSRLAIREAMTLRPRSSSVADLAVVAIAKATCPPCVPAVFAMAALCHSGPKPD